MVAKETNHHVTTTKSFLAIKRFIREITTLQLGSWRSEGLLNCKVVVALITRLIARKDLVVVT